MKMKAKNIGLLMATLVLPAFLGGQTFALTKPEKEEAKPSTRKVRPKKDKDSADFLASLTAPPAARHEYTALNQRTVFSNGPSKLSLAIGGAAGVIGFGDVKTGFAGAGMTVGYQFSRYFDVSGQIEILRFWGPSVFAPMLDASVGAMLTVGSHANIPIGDYISFRPGVNVGMLVVTSAPAVLNTMPSTTGMTGRTMTTASVPTAPKMASVTSVAGVVDLDLLEFKASFAFVHDCKKPEAAPVVAPASDPVQAPMAPGPIAKAAGAPSPTPEVVEEVDMCEQPKSNQPGRYVFAKVNPLGIGAVVGANSTAYGFYKASVEMGFNIPSFSDKKAPGEDSHTVY